MAATEPLSPLQLPPVRPLPTQYVQQLQAALHAASWAGVDATRVVLPAPVLLSILAAAIAVLEKEPTLVELTPSKQALRVTVVGDTHGQYHDVCHMLDRFGVPSSDRLYIFNGDYVDRGAWGVETLVLLAAWKAALPHNVMLLRGNHEAATVTRMYGFHAELTAKYGRETKVIFAAVRRLFAALPLAALIERTALVLHGGLFRAPQPSKANSKTGKRRRCSGGAAGGVALPGSLACLGSLADLRRAGKGGQDPDPQRSANAQLACDVMWSDPVNTPGLHPNEARGLGTVYGPDATQAFMSANGLRLVVRSHEGPDARDRRCEGDRMPSVDGGYAEDHVVEAGRLVTLFSAPDYPQFMAPGEERYRNRGAVLHLSAPDYSTPAVEEFDAVLPRPQVKSYYDLPASDDEQQEEDETPAGRQLAGEQGVPGEGPQQPIMAESEPSPGSGDQLAACTTATAAADGDSPGASCTAAHDKATCHASAAVAGGTPVEHDRMMNACETGDAAAAVSGESL